MPSSTSSSKVNPVMANPLLADPVFERETPALGRCAWLALLVSLVLMLGFEAWVRNQGVTPSYRNSEGLWAEQRRRIHTDAGDGWVFTGSSRVLFDLQLPVWERLDGRRPLQLALEGTSPLRVLESLADDDDFTGKLIVGVSPGIFFSGFEYRGKVLDRYPQESPAQWFGQKLSLLVEPYLAFYNFDFALSTILRRQSLPAREGVDSEMEVRKFENLGRDRNTRMWERMEHDEDYAALVRFIWADGWKPMNERPEEVQQRILEARPRQLDRAVAVVEKLHKKGVVVIFAQLPYEGHYAVSEPDIAPRKLTWDPLLERSGALGLHFQEHQEMQGYWLPEWSHLSAAEADRFTAAFYNLVQRELTARE